MILIRSGEKVRCLRNDVKANKPGTNQRLAPGDIIEVSSIMGGTIFYGIGNGEENYIPIKDVERVSDSGPPVEIQPGDIVRCIQNTETCSRPDDSDRMLRPGDLIQVHSIGERPNGKKIFYKVKVRGGIISQNFISMKNVEFVSSGPKAIQHKLQELLENLTKESA